MGEWAREGRGEGDGAWEMSHVIQREGGPTPRPWGVEVMAPNRVARGR